MTAIFTKLGAVLESRKIYFIILISCYALGIILGFAFYGEQERIIFHDNSIEFVVLVLKQDKSCFSLFLHRFLNIVGIFIVFIASGFIVYLCPIHFVIVVYRGYVLSIAAIVFCNGFGITGCALFLFCILLQNAVTTFALIIFSTFAFDLSIRANKCSELNYNSYFSIALITFIVAIIGAFIEFLILSLVIRPLYFYF